MPSILEIIGPAMIGPSSSHTLGAMRISKFAYNLNDGVPNEVVFYLHGSFQDTYIGHGTWLALLGGICGLKTDDPQVAQANEVAKKIGLKYEYKAVDLGNVHPNTVKIVTEKSGIRHEIIGSSIGAGRIKIISIDSIECDLDGEYPTLIVENQDVPGALESIINVLSFYGVNIATMQLKRESKYLHKASAMIELDNTISKEILERIRNMDVVNSALYVNAIVEE
ncbi:L-serine ammonia-lyase, iron-sulfur-dependent subunit beta [Mesoaciditoga sp.]